MPVTRVALRPGVDVASVDLAAGLLVPRLISRAASTATVALVAGGALLLGGDRVEIDVDVAPGCRLDLTDVGGTVAYDAQGVSSSWSVRINVGDGGSLSWHGLPLVAATGADVERTMRVDLGIGARALVRETTVLGRSGETGGRVAQRTQVWAGDLPVVVEAFDADANRPAPGIIGTHRVVDTVLAVGYRPPVSDVDLQLAQPGAIARFLGTQAHLSELDRVWERWSAALNVRISARDESMEDDHVGVF